ncbi:MAG: HupE/UreJ family protein, partial [Cryomorphaceae bacterium]
VHNIIRGNAARKSMGFAYAIALFFGLIHGMGFSNYLTQLLAGSDVAMPLFAFNVGIEVGQIAIVIAYFILATILFQVLRYKQRDWIMVLSGICAGAALVLAKEAVFW